MKFSKIAPSAIATVAALSAQASASNNFGIVYSPYNSDGTCKSTSEVASDLAPLSEYGVIRIYGTDCNQVANVLAGKSSNQKVFAGIFYMNDIEGCVSTIASAVKSTGSSWDDIHTVSVGNELVNNGEATVDQIGEYVSTARSALTSAGYSGSVVSVDTFIAVINNPGLCEHSDYMAVNAHAYFDYNTAAADAGPWVLEQVQKVWYACEGSKNVLITESGWPSQGETYGLAVPSDENQKTAIASIQDTCGDDVIFYSAYNTLWQDAGAYGVNKYFGIYD
ncbi:putative 17 glucosidase scw10 [Hanseniaspora osmophila]|uniref:Putative family 17 glucosidase SCW4 n=1 Tax=Hanseniaspora osmophila TaxID=56408 RepID=A0A1E5RHE1_9ASCO|nr:putative family 17 glucosidase SCW4 [Hanseniaspora osmophila]